MAEEFKMEVVSSDNPMKLMLKRTATSSSSSQPKKIRLEEEPDPEPPPPSSPPSNDFDAPLTPDVDDPDSKDYDTDIGEYISLCAEGEDMDDDDDDPDYSTSARIRTTGKRKRSTTSSRFKNQATYSARHKPSGSSSSSSNTLNIAPPSPPMPIQHKAPPKETPEPAAPQRKRGRGPAKRIGLSLDDEHSLYAIVKNGRTALQSVVDEWIEAYKSNRDMALLQLMQFFINAAGCKGRITAHMQSSMEHTAIIRKMTEEFDEESGEYPLIQSGQPWKKFRNNFCDFVGTLVKQCQYSIIYDQYLMDNVISLLTGLSDSQVRAFRHTATLAAMKLMTALVDVALTVSVNLDNTQRQYETERQKSRDKRASDRLETLMSKRQELEENMDEIKNMLTYMFKSVFVHRYRDTVPEIRGICMLEIGIWMKKFHQNFLDDSYLKYIGWTLHDKVGDVRLKCLQALQPLYASEELKGKLELFTSKFKDRIVAMTLDKEYDVAVQAVRLVISILKYHREILTDKDCEHVYELVYSSHRSVAMAAGEFLNERLFIPDEETEVGQTKKGKKRSPNTPLIRDLVQFFIESELHEHGAYLVDSLIDSNEMMKDWECMTELLLEEPGEMEEALDDRQETSLIEIMTCALKQAATGDPPVGRGPSRKIQSAKEHKQVQDDKNKLTEHFIKALPPLLSKYMVDPEKVANLVLIPQYFELELFTSLRQEKNLDLLLRLMAEVVEKHTDSEVLETCAKTLETLCSDQLPIYSRCDVARSYLLDIIVCKYREANDEYTSLVIGNEKPDEDETFALVSSLKKISVFYACHNLGPLGIWDSLSKCVQEAQKKAVSATNDDEVAIPDQAVKYCISGCFYGLLWDLKDIEAKKSAGANVTTEIQSLKERLHSFLDCCKELIAVRTKPMYMEEAYITICDLLIVFCSQLGSHMQDLVYNTDRSFQHLLNEFIQNVVFIEEDDEEQDEHTKIEELHKRRNFLACFCKLVVYNVLPIRVAADVFKHYVKYYNDYGDIIKQTLSKAREINKVSCARTMAISLSMLFKYLLKEGGEVVRQSEDFISLKELAKRFALSFGLDAVKNREAVTALHREGILFAVSTTDATPDPMKPPPNLAFLEILSEFTNKLLKQDKRVVLTYLDKRIATGMPSSRGEDWQPLLLYRNSLVQGENDIPASAPSRRAYSRRKVGLHASSLMGLVGVDDLDDDFEEDDAADDADYRPY